MNKHLPECPTAEIDCEVGDLGQCNCDEPHPCICVGLRACEERTLIEAQRTVAGFLDLDETGWRKCSEPKCDLCVVAPLIYGALEDLIISKGNQP
jgi:hypothetical protein